MQQTNPVCMYLSPGTAPGNLPRYIHRSACEVTSCYNGTALALAPELPQPHQAYRRPKLPRPSLQARGSSFCSSPGPDSSLQNTMI